MRIRSLFCLSLLAFSCVCVAQSTRSASTELKLPLTAGWSLQSSTKVTDSGDVISTPKFQPKDWYGVSVPTTVFAALVNQKVYPDPTFGMNLRSVPGVTYPIGANFSNRPMEPDSPYAVPWWYRKAFDLSASYKGKTIWLRFGGINYRANLWLNGKRIAKQEDVAGAWRTHEFNITDAVHVGGANALAVQVWAPTEKDLAITFVDWNPAPPDKNMGLWRDVDIVTSGPVAVRYPAVMSKVDSPANDKAHLTVTALLKNGTNQPVKGTLQGKIDRIEIAQEVELAPGELKDIVFSPDKFPQLSISNPRLWWPRQMGTPEQYRLDLQFTAGGRVSDQAETQFGIRQIDSTVVAANARVFTINGKRILIRGGGWSPDMMLRQTHRLEDDFRYVEDMGLNTIRLEGKLETEEFFDLADRDGVLLMAGWCCCDHWEHWGDWKDEDFGIARESLRDQIYRLRSHPSLVMWLNGSDNPPPPDVEQMYLGVEKDLLWPNPTVSSATAKLAGYSGESGVKMSGPYEYVAPSYWMKDSVDADHPRTCNQGGCGGAYGFNSETSPGPEVPPIESMEAMIGKDHLWPIDDWWNYHAGGGAFKDMHVFTDALNARYGPSNSAEEYTSRAQVLDYEGIRAMYEAYSRNKYTSTGVIQWMLNNAWPSVIWHLYDYYLRPSGSYFGAKKALQPLNPVYGYDDHSVWLVSSQYVDAKGLKLTAKILNLDMTEKFSQQVAVDALADSTQKVIILPQIADLSPTYFLVLRAEDSSGKLVGSNFYWLSTKPETIDWEKSNWFTTPTASYADYTALSQLPKVKLNVTSRNETTRGGAVTHVTLENPSKSLAFFVRLKVNSAGKEILPVVWEDNYISLLPGEKRELTAAYDAALLSKSQPQPTVEVKGWNVE